MYCLERSLLVVEPAQDYYRHTGSRGPYLVYGSETLRIGEREVQQYNSEVLFGETFYRLVEPPDVRHPEPIGARLFQQHTHQHSITRIVLDEQDLYRCGLCHPGLLSESIVTDNLIISLRQFHYGEPEVLDCLHDLYKAVQVYRLDDKGVRVQVVGLDEVPLSLGGSQYHHGHEL